MSHEVPLILDHFFVHNSWTAIFQIFENSPLLVVESFSTYYGEVPLQKKWLNVKFTLYLITHMKANLILHRERVLQFSLMIRKFTLYLIPRFVTKLKLHRRGIKNYRIMLSRNRWNALFTMVWGWLFSSLIWRENKCHDDKNYVSVLNPLQIQCFQGLQGILRFS